jgi:DNA-directed RNA polymerase specialized sigma24 family protein
MCESFCLTSNTAYLNALNQGKFPKLTVEEEVLFEKNLGKLPENYPEILVIQKKNEEVEWFFVLAQQRFLLRKQQNKLLFYPFSFKDYLATIKTNWTELEEIQLQGSDSLAEYLASRYSYALFWKIKQFCPQLQDEDIYNLLQEIFIEILTEKIIPCRRRGHLKGLFKTIIQRKIYKFFLGKEANSALTDSFKELMLEDTLLDIRLDLDEILETLKVEKPNLYYPVEAYYFQNYRCEEIAKNLNIKVETVKQRLFLGRQWLEARLKDYAP